MWSWNPWSSCSRHSGERCIKSMYGAAAAAPPGNRSGRDQYAARRRTPAPRPSPFGTLATPVAPTRRNPRETRTTDSPAYITHYWDTPKVTAAAVINGTWTRNPRLSGLWWCLMNVCFIHYFSSSNSSRAREINRSCDQTISEKKTTVKYLPLTKNCSIFMREFYYLYGVVQSNVSGYLFIIRGFSSLSTSFVGAY